MKIASLGTLSLMVSTYVNPTHFTYSTEQIQEQPKKIYPIEFSELPYPEYENISYSLGKWENIAQGLDFSRTEIYKSDKLVDVIAAIKINPEKNKLRVFNAYSKSGTEAEIIENWQKKTNALAMINSNQYMANPYYYPCALVICDEEQKGPKKNKASRGMLLAEPKNLESKLNKIDLLDFDYDNFDYKTTQYTQGVQHWPILLDREGKIKVDSTLWQANRTVVAKTKDNEILFMTTEGGFFTLYNFARFLKESNKKPDKGFNIHTAMNMDGGYEANMVVKSPNLEYLTYGEFETYGPKNDATVFNRKIAIPGVIGVFPRN